MKKAKDDKPTITMPKGAYECGTINQELRKNKNNSLNSLSTDIQGNGYPVSQSEKQF